MWKKEGGGGGGGWCRATPSPSELPCGGVYAAAAAPENAMQIAAGFAAKAGYDGRVRDKTLSRNRMLEENRSGPRVVTPRDTPNSCRLVLVIY